MLWIAIGLAIFTVNHCLNAHTLATLWKSNRIRYANRSSWLNWLKRDVTHVATHALDT